ncbi:hypothetical protein TELCIR_23136, partial [Teladorsagia circumcincta]
MQEEGTSSNAEEFVEGLLPVVPLTTCPHLTQTTEVPEEGIDANSVCDVCNEAAEPWVCLTCYKASAYVV